jgi:PAS domain S-box-containing protein
MSISSGARPAGHWIPGITESAVLFLAYFLAAKLGLTAPFTSANVSPVWPASGIALVGLLIWGVRFWPAITLAAFLANFTTPIPAAAAVGIALGNTGSAVLGALLLHWAGMDRLLPRLKDVLSLSLLGAAVSPIIAATVGVTSLLFAGAKPWSGFGSAWLVWWAGDAMGVLILAPLLLKLREIRTISRARLIRFAAVLVLLSLTSWAVFENRIGFAGSDEWLAFLVFPFVIWISARFGLGAVALADVAIAMIAVTETSAGSGPFARYGAFENAISLQFYLAVTSVSGLTLAAAIAERQRAEGALEREQRLLRELQEAEFRFQQLAENIDAVFWMVEPEAKRLLYVSPAYERIWNRTRHSLYENQQSFLEAVHPEDRERVLSALEEQAQLRATAIEYRIVRPDGTVRWIFDRGFPISNHAGQATRIAGIAEDITERKLAEEMLRQADKLATMGRLTATIAHEINNPLTAISNLGYLLDTHPNLDKTARQYTDALLKELERVTKITKQTLAFYRESRNPVAVSVSELLDEVLQTYSKPLQEKQIQVERQYFTSTQIEAYPVEIAQVFSNLIANSIDAMSSAGKILIEVRDARRQRESGVYVLVADTGSGVPLHLREKIFEPFFSTKGREGTGLGLWVTSGIVRKHGGDVELLSPAEAPLSGAAFAVFLPRLFAKGAQVAARAS